jgi:hypothetical protein
MVDATPASRRPRIGTCRLFVSVAVLANHSVIAGLCRKQALTYGRQSLASALKT